MFLFLCSFSIAFWGCLVLFYFCLRFIKNFQIIREEFPFFSQFFTIHLNCCGGLAIVRNPGRPWRITPCPAVLGWAFLCFVGIISTVSRQLRYSPSRACVCLPPGFLTLWLYLPSCRFAHGYCRGLALCLAQHHIECHHEAEAHHKCYGGAV